MGGTWICVWIFVNILGVGVGGSFILKFFFFFFWWGLVYFLNLGRKFFFKFLFQNFFHFFFCFVMEVVLFFVQHSLIHSHNFFCVFGESVSVGRCAFLFLGKDKQVNNCFWKIWVALRRGGWCDLCRLICSFGLTLLAGLAGKS